MGAVNTVFKRYEKKYHLTQEQYQRFRQLIEPYMQVDEYGKSTICNIYYDTESFDLIRASIEKPVYKEKLRLRSYGVPQASDNVFLEIKKKYRGIVYKRRIVMPLEQAQKGIRSRNIPDDSQIGREINYFLKHYDLMPRLFLAYDRIAMYGKENENLRMTFDFAIRSREDTLDLSEGDSGELYFDGDDVLLEIKAEKAYPLWLVRALEECNIYPESFSKYGNIYKKTLLPKYLKMVSKDSKSAKKLK